VINKVALNIYNKQWLIEPQSALNLLDLWERIMDNQTTWRAEKDDAENGYRQLKKLFAQSSVILAPDNVWDAEQFSGFDGADVAIIPVNGPLMKYDYCGWFGTANLGNMFKLADSTASIKSIVLLVDSPGGTVDGTSAFADLIKKSRKTTMAVVDGMAASAAYWISSSANEVIATSKTDIIGSIGTMVSWWDRSKAMENNGYVLREYYASKSVDKNRGFREANAGDGRMLIQEMLDPINNEFTGAVKSNRSGKLDLATEDVLTGKTYISSRAKEVGLIDNIMSFEKAIARSLQLAKTIK
jgi:ClpP class serine protease